MTRTDGTGNKALLPNALGSTVALDDGSGSLSTQYIYEPFGYTTAAGSANSNSYKYTGREDDGTGLLREGPQATGMGLQTMRYRAGLIGGKLEVGPGLRGGASVVCRLPPKSSPDRRGSLRRRRRN